MNLGALPLLPPLQDGLARVDECLRTTVVADDPGLTDVARHLISAGGKRLRPALVIASALAGFDRADSGLISQRTVYSGAAIELVHLGSLYHDDVLDDAKTRRGVPSVNAKWGNFMAIIAGDYLLAKASSLSSAIGVDATDRLAQTLAELCEGQVREQQSSFNIERSADNYESSISGKTASLISTAMFLGAKTASLPDASVEALSQFGHAFGMAFQIRDDLLDVIGDDDQLGKPAGNDIVEGVYSLPVIRALEDDSVFSQLHTLLGRPIDLAERDRVIELVRASTGIARTLDAGRQWSLQAQEALNVLPETEVVSHLRTLARNLFDDLEANQLTNKRSVSSGHESTM